VFDNCHVHGGRRASFRENVSQREKSTSQVPDFADDLKCFRVKYGTLIACYSSIQFNFLARGIYEQANKNNRHLLIGSDGRDDFCLR
jgi:hypothetical protein